LKSITVDKVVTLQAKVHGKWFILKKWQTKKLH